MALGSMCVGKIYGVGVRGGCGKGVGRVSRANSVRVLLRQTSTAVSAVSSSHCTLEPAARELPRHQLLANKAMSLTPDALLSVFKSIDLDSSGTIELSELEAFCAPCLLGDDQSRITELFAQVDTDGSGEISFDEFCEARGDPLASVLAIDRLIQDNIQRHTSHP